ncbi:hypothetical protein AYI70_g289, partial [Smittium culicis]
ADSFYGSQGRLGSNFVDENENLIPTLKKKYSDAVSLEMEAHMLYHLAAVSKDAQSGEQSIKAACALIVFADRTGNEFITPEASQIAVEHCTEAIFNTLVEENFKGNNLHPVEGSVWEGSVPDAPIVSKQETPIETRAEEPKEPTPEAVKEASPEAVKEASPEAVKEASPKAVKEETPEATEDAEEEV